MRLNAEELNLSPLAYWIQSFFNGTDITYICYESDDKEGWAVVFIATQVNPGQVPWQLVADENGEPIPVTIKGKVEIILKPDAPEAARLEFERRKQQEN